MTDPERDSPSGETFLKRKITSATFVEIKGLDGDCVGVTISDPSFSNSYYVALDSRDSMTIDFMKGETVLINPTLWGKTYEYFMQQAMAEEGNIYVRKTHNKASAPLKEPEVLTAPVKESEHVEAAVKAVVENLPVAGKIATPGAASATHNVVLTYKEVATQEKEKPATYDWTDEPWDCQVVNVGVAVEKTVIERGIIFDATWGHLGKSLTVIAELLHVAGKNKVSLGNNYFDGINRVDDKTIKHVNYIAGFCLIFSKTWERDHLNSNHHLSAGFREAGKRLMRAINFKEHLRPVEMVFGALNDDLRNAIAGLIREQDKCVIVREYFEALIRAFAAVVVKSRKISDTEEFWLPKRVSIINKMTPVRNVKVEKVEKGKKKTIEIKSSPMNCAVSVKQRMFATGKELEVLRRWNEETSIPNWKLSRHTPCRFYTECETARFLINELNTQISVTRRELRDRKKKCYSDYLKELGTRKKEDLPYATFATEFVSKLTASSEILSLKFAGAEETWSACEARVLRGELPVEVETPHDE